MTKEGRCLSLLSLFSCSFMSSDSSSAEQRNGSLSQAALILSRPAASLFTPLRSFRTRRLQLSEGERETVGERDRKRKKTNDGEIDSFIVSWH